jgi:hypothetical protein
MLSSRLRRYAVTFAAVTAVALPLTSLNASASASTVSGRSFGMHYLNTSDPLLVSFGSARIWGGDAPTWAQLQPARGTTSAAALAQLDKLVARYRAAGAQPMITLGMTPAWATRHCRHWYSGVNWGIETCAPYSATTTGVWGKYVRMLASRYRGKVPYFELWNEPSLHNGYNGPIRTLAKMQASAQKILHEYGEKLVSPAIPFTDGDGTPKHGLSWLNTFLHQPGGKNFDIFGVHLYTSDAAAKAGWGPEWAMSALSSARAVLRRNGVKGKPTWNTEANVGRVPANSAIGGGTRGAAMVARTFVLATEHGVARTFWYAADDRSWGGTWLESSNARYLTAAGRGYVTARNVLLGAHPRGCSATTVGTHKWHYFCRYRLHNGQGMIAVWSTGRAFHYHGPRGTKRVVWVTGGGRRASHATRLSVGSAPVYVIGWFKV